MTRTTVEGGERRRHVRTWRSIVALAATGLVFSACGLHVSKHGVSGNVFGHKFSAESGSLPAGFPSDVPQPDNSRVLGGGGADNYWDAAFAATGSQSSGTTAYASKFQAAGYSVTNVQNGSQQTNGTSGTNPNSTSTTVTLTGSVFTAHNAQWTVQVETGTTTSSTAGALRSGEYAINITVVPTSSITSTT